MIGNIRGVLRPATGRRRMPTRWHCLVVGIVLLALAVLLAPRTPAAQQAGKVARVGYLSTAFPECSAALICQAMTQRLQELGYVEGQNLRIEFRTDEEQHERLPALAAELVRLPVDVLVATGPEAMLRAARQATSSIPIVMLAIGYDPIARGYIDGLARPGGNITGVFFLQLELTPKGLELLKEALPQLTRVVALWDVHSADQLQVAEAAAQSLGLQLQSVELRNPPYDFAGAMGVAVRERAQALVVLSSPLFGLQRSQIAELALKNRLPSIIIGFREYAEAGGLMAYGVNLSDIWRSAADYVDKILKGAKPATLPVQTPMKFEFAINLKTAEALGLTLPPQILIFADTVIR